MPFFLSGFFLSGFLSFLCHRLIPPFQSATAEGLREDKFNFTTRLSNHHAFFVNHFSNDSKNNFRRSRATFSLEARGIFLVWPLRQKIITSFSSLSIPDSAPLTSLATTRSQFFSRNFFCALVARSLVSAAKPTSR